MSQQWPSEFGCDCSARHVSVSMMGMTPQDDVHVVDWPAGGFYIGGPCSCDATQEDGLCDHCRRFAARTTRL